MWTRVLALLALYVASVHSFSWDLVFGRETQLEFVYKGTVTYTDDFSLSHAISSVTYDPVHYRVLFVEDDGGKMPIYSFDLTTRKTQTLAIALSPGYTVPHIAYDTATRSLFWCDSKVYSLSLKPASSNEAVNGNLIATIDFHCGDIDVYSRGGYVYWVTRNNIERAAFDGSEREVLINEPVYWRRSLAIDQQTKTMYWIEMSYFNIHSIESANLSGKNRRRFYLLEGFAAALTVSKDFIYWRINNPDAIVQLPKRQQHGVAPVVYAQTGSMCGWCQVTAANYTIEEQTLGNEIPDVEEHHGSVCHNYCFQGNCTVSAEGHPKCSCEAGYSGERCEGNPCHMYCLNNGVCSMNEAEKPVCNCNRGYSGERCEVSICKDYCFQGICIVSTEGLPNCSCEAGYSGERCEVNPCHMYCSNNGVCSLNEAEKPVCQCTADYEGERCNVFICKDYCLQGNCSIGTEGQRICSCEAGYSGERCEANPCHMYCLNNGVCSVNEAEKPVCQCTADFKGERCEVSICKDYCLQGNCIVSTEGQPTCRCTAGYTGERCQVNACHEHCLNNGDCSLNEEDEPFCQCTADYEGERCDIAATHHVDDMTLQILRDLRSEMKQVIREERQSPCNSPRIN